VNSKRLTKEELRHDEFVETTARITNYLQTNFMTVLVVLAGIALAVVVSVFFIQSQKRTAVQADQAFFRVTSRYAQGVYSEVLTEADAVLERFGDRDEGKWTLYYAGAAHLALSENDRAIERFDEYLARDAGGQYALSARMGKALALESRGDVEQAVSIYQELRAETESEDAIHVQAALAETRALQELGRSDDAIAVLESMLVGASPEVRQEIENRLQTLRALRQ
jgi:tetratricopeptide (TPR) repeat protein